jgi:hypothetical protein
MMITEIVGGWLFGSMALMSDGLHMSTHVAALSNAAVALPLADAVTSILAISALVAGMYCVRDRTPEACVPHPASGDRRRQGGGTRQNQRRRDRFRMR